MGQTARDLAPERSALHRFGVALRQRRLDHALSLEDLARRIHFHRGYVGHIEAAEKHASRQFAELCDQVLDAHGALLGLWEQADNEHLVRRKEHRLTAAYGRDSEQLSRWIQSAPADQLLQKIDAKVRGLAVDYLTT